MPRASVKRARSHASAILLAAILASLSGTAVRTDEQTWTLANDRVQATFSVTAGGLILNELRDLQTDRTLSPEAGADSTIAINGSTSSLGASSSGWILDGSEQADTDNGGTLTFTFHSQKAPIVATRSYAIYNGSPAIETWTTFRSTGSAAVLTNPTMLQFTAPASTIHYALGLSGDSAASEVDDAFTLRDAGLARGDELTLLSPNRSTEQYLPMIAGDIGDDEFFAGLEWSGSWQIIVRGTGDQRVQVTAGIPSIATTVDASHTFETPHTFFGFTPGGRGDVAAALRSFVVQGLRQGRPFHPLVTYNTWFAYGTDVDEGAIENEMAGAASVGVELFVLDAGWYLGAGQGSDFESGLGSWTVDSHRFPNGLGALREYAHSLGMQFGLWVEPERVNQSTIGKPQLVQQAWLATNGGSYKSSTMAQVCFGSPAARQWVLDRLFRLLDDAQPDYLKWDNNFWINCTRSGHGHGASDGNYAHVRGLYDVMQALRDRYPDMTIENCAQGGNRMDFGLLRYTDTAWMDDRTHPASHVRHNLEGLMTFFPPSYLLSFVLNDSEPLADSPDIQLFVRSRMPGALGLTYFSQDLGESDRDALAGEIGVYKQLRDTLENSSGTLLTDQVSSGEGEPGWDAIQELDADTGESIIFGFQNDGAVPATVVMPHRLQREARYVVSLASGEALGTRTGADLMDNGLEIEQSFDSASRVIILRPQTSRGSQ